MDSSKDWQPEPALVNFLHPGPLPVYVGFGSMFINGGKEKTQIVLDALRLARQRGVLATGWGGLTAANISEDSFVIDTVSHDWLFSQTTAVVHHGGAGTTGASLRTGKPTMICPFVGDQRFWGRRVAALGVGPVLIPQRRLTAESFESLANTITSAVTNHSMSRRAAALGEIIRAEAGVGRAVALIQSQLRQLLKALTDSFKATSTSPSSASTTLKNS